MAEQKSEPKSEKTKQTAAKSRFYKIEGGKIKRLRPSCPRCGPGVFMGEHQDRFVCGKCGYTTFKR
ncbi:MAG: 30S ribosomal protein S27 [Hadesarchaea archaeon YNP_N21]|jgi:small subunit ribosomal protein S27Ae|nr:MAG: 30S ribosomal protein S27 [Hadesarchaea archaeon YNP_N21]